MAVKGKKIVAYECKMLATKRRGLATLRPGPVYRLSPEAYKAVKAAVDPDSVKTIHE